MTSVAEVMLWGRRIGAVSIEDETAYATFQYEPEFVDSRVEVAPLQMPLAEQPYIFPALPEQTFHGLPGMLADSLPDRYGTALIDTWLAQQGRSADSFDVVERLSYVAGRGMGALEFRPAISPQPPRDVAVDIGALVQLASEVLADREHLMASLRDGQREEAIKEILSVGTSAGGARAKAVVAWNPDTNEVRSGQVSSRPGFEDWLLKFDGVRGGDDRNRLAETTGYGAIEFAYSMMARDAGLVMTECRLMEEGGRRHFMTRRFDRDDSGDKVHMQTLCGIAHFDFNLAGAYSYEQAFQVIGEMDLGEDAAEQLFRRMVFNVVARNQDDHVKNISFMMDRNGEWRLSPAYDVTFAFNPRSRWTGRHQMSINGKRDNITRDDLDRVARQAALKRGKPAEIVEQVTEAVSRWLEKAEVAGVNPARAEQIGRVLLIDLPAA